MYACITSDVIHNRFKNTLKVEHMPLTCFSKDPASVEAGNCHEREAVDETEATVTDRQIHQKHVGWRLQ